MKIYLINKETKEVVREFSDVIGWADNYVMYSQNGNRGKIYASEDEYFTDTEPTKGDEPNGKQ